MIKKFNAGRTKGRPDRVHGLKSAANDFGAEPFEISDRIDSDRGGSRQVFLVHAG
ncbi:hypothetical protein [Mesorhizobium sp. WSM2239]|uniref:Uncharacterized protein n=2 Tax=unclassified Mesorhizobium TaxID=325217 RepID=A0AAU8D4N7_9HYPH